MTRKWRWLAAAACFGMMAAACGSDDDEGGGGAATTDAGGATTMAESETTTADSETTEPESETTEPESETTEPESETTEPESETTEPESETTEPESETTEAESETTEAESETTEPTGPSVDPASIATDIGVDDSTIRVGMLADLSGIFAPLVQEIVEAQQVYWDDVNANGGIAGRQVELVIEDNAYDVAVNVEKYQILRDQVAIISQATGSPHTAAIAQDLVNDDLIAIPLSWYSGWADPEIGQNALESYTSYCIESLNGIEWLRDNEDVQTVAIISFPGEYGGDGAAGARMAADALGLEVVYDGTGLVTPPSPDNPTPDQSSVVSEIVRTQPDLVWATVNPGALTAIMSSAVGQGYAGVWSGNSPTYSFKLLGTELAPLLDEFFIQSTYIVTWGTDVPGMQEVVDKMTEARPDLVVSDVYILGWTEAMITQAILEQAAANGDMTRAGIVAAANEVEVQFDGLAPDQTWAGEPNDYIVRESYIYDVSLEDYVDAPLSSGEGSTGSVLLEGPYTGTLAEEYQFDGACYVG